MDSDSDRIRNGNSTTVIRSHPVFQKPNIILPDNLIFPGYYEEAKVSNAVKTREQKQQARDWMKKRHGWREGATGIPGFMNNEEYFVTRKTAPFQTLLGEGAAPNHRGDAYRTKGVFSRVPENGIYPKFKPRK